MNNKTEIIVAVALATTAAFGGLFDNVKSNLTEKVEAATEAAQAAQGKLLSLSASSTSGVSDAELLELMHKVYAEEIKTEAGRVRWWGKLVNQIVDTNALVKVNVYANGNATTNAWRLVTALDSVKASAARYSVMTNGIPAKLAAARAKRAAILNGGVTETNIVTEVGHTLEGVVK